MIMVYLISYDLKSPGKDYNDLYTEIKSLGEWHHFLESEWFVNTTASADVIKNTLRKKMDNNDRVFVNKMVSGYSGWLDNSTGEWLKNHLI